MSGTGKPGTKPEEEIDLTIDEEEIIPIISPKTKQYPDFYESDGFGVFDGESDNSAKASPNSSKS